MSNTFSISAQSYIEISVDNDLYFKTDHYYSSGIFISYGKKKEDKIYYWTLAQHIYNPSLRYTNDISVMDYPYSGWLFAQHEREYFLKENSIKGKAVQSWAGLNIGGSSFNPNYEMTDAGDILASGGLNPGFLEDQEGTVTSLDENMMVGVNRKIEVNLGMTIKERFVLEGALQYVQTELVQQSNFMIENISYPISMASPNISTAPKVKDKSIEKMQEVSYTTTETELENRIDFASVSYTHLTLPTKRIV